MSTIETTRLGVFHETCEVVHVPAGAERLGVFLSLPWPTQQAILREIEKQPGFPRNSAERESAP